MFPRFVVNSASNAGLAPIHNALQQRELTGGWLPVERGWSGRELAHADG